MIQSLNWLDDEEVEFEKTCIKGLLSAEDIEKLRFDESLSVLDRASLILSEGHESQKISLANNLPTLFTEEPLNISELLPKFAEMVNSASTELLTICGKCVTKLLTNAVLSPNQVSTHLTPLLWTHVASNEAEVQSVWLTSLITYILLTERELIKKNNIANLVVAKGNLSQKTSSRIACAKLITALCPKLDMTQIESDICPVIRMLCQDIDYDVRSAMCSSLVDISRTLGVERTVKFILPEIHELLQDEEMQVRNMAISVLIDICPLLSKEIIAQNIAPTIWSYLDSAICDKPSAALVTVAKHFGKIALNLAEVMDDSQNVRYAKYFKKLCNTHQFSNGGANENGLATQIILPITMESIDKKDTDICDSLAFLCAYNFPAVCFNIGGKLVVQEGLLDVFTGLTNHPHFSVRRTLAAGIHETAKTLGGDSKLLLPVYKSLLEDPSLQVPSALVYNIIPALSHFAISPPKGQAPTVGLPHLILPLLNHEERLRSSRDWRTYTCLIDNWAAFTKILTPEQISENFAPRLLKLMSTNVMLPVKRAILKTLIKYLHKCKYVQQRHDLTQQIVKGLSRGKKFGLRLMFVELCHLILQTFSKKFFKEHCFTPALLLINDPIPIVRIKSSGLLPHLKTQLKMPSDRPMLQQLEACSRRCLMSERNKDVLSHIQQAVMELDSGDVKLDSEPDKADKKREEDQNSFVVKEEKLNDAKGRPSLPDITSMDLNSKRSRKSSMASFSDSDHHTGKSVRKMSHAVVSSRRAAGVPNSASGGRRASLPSAPISEVTGKLRTKKINSVKLKNANK